MKSTLRRLCLCLAWLLLLVPLGANAQIVLKPYLDTGEGVAASGFLFRAAPLGSIQRGHDRVQAGLQFDVVSAWNTVATGSHLSYGRGYDFQRMRLEGEALIQYNHPSRWLSEMYLGAQAKATRGHWRLHLGAGARMYHTTRQAATTFGIDDNRSLWEWNTMYHFQYHLLPVDNAWNAAVAITNTDYFLVQQENSPMLYAMGRMPLMPDLNLWVELWYKAAGVFNGSANYYGMFLRTGISWTIVHGH